MLPAKISLISHPKTQRFLSPSLTLADLYQFLMAWNPKPLPCPKRLLLHSSLVWCGHCPHIPEGNSAPPKAFVASLWRKNGEKILALSPHLVHWGSSQVHILSITVSLLLPG